MKINKRFQDYINEKNRWAKLTGKKEITFPLKQEDVEHLSGCLSGELSPENLTCDGELAPSKVRTRYTKLIGVSKDLKSYCDSNNLRWIELYN